jgi:PhzF family phenazine biosynthesis protein
VKIRYYHVDAFASEPFRGNPAGVCPLEKWLPDERLQRIAAENNHPETAFFVEKGGVYELRWFTPMVEMDLCGHATLASAHVLFTHDGYRGSTVTFESKSGRLVVEKKDGLYYLDFPSRPASPCEAPAELLRGLSTPPVEVMNARDFLVVFSSEQKVRALNPDMALLSGLPFGIICTARGEDVDFVSRFFAPSVGIPEDPVTGSSHCTLIPYWSAKLGKKSLSARQISARGGELSCEDLGDRVRIGGRAVTYMAGSIDL